MSNPDVGKLDLSDSSDPQDLFASPSKVSKSNPKNPSKPNDPNAPSQRSTGESKYDAEAAREASLQKELESVRSINEVIEGVVSSLECAKGNMDVSSISPWYLGSAFICWAPDLASNHKTHADNPNRRYQEQ